MLKALFVRVRMHLPNLFTAWTYARNPHVDFPLDLEGYGERFLAALALSYGLAALSMLLALVFSPNLDLKTCLHCDRKVLAEMFVTASCAVALFLAVVIASIPKG